MGKAKLKKANTSTSKPPGKKRGPKPSGRPRHTDNFSERIEPPPIPDPEDEFDDESSLDDNSIGEMFKNWDGGKEKHAHIIFPPPKKNPIFVRKWKNLIETIATRDSFKPVHLFQLEVLCDLFVEYEQLSKWIRMNGYTYVAFGRSGKQIKTYPQVAERNRVKDQIRGYSKMLDLITPKGSGGKGAKQGDEWS